jgi:hypothetical protein
MDPIDHFSPELCCTAEHKIRAQFIYPKASLRVLGIVALEAMTGDKRLDVSAVVVEISLRILQGFGNRLIVLSLTRFGSLSLGNRKGQYEGNED